MFNHNTILSNSGEDGRRVSATRKFDFQKVSIEEAIDKFKGNCDTIS
jgi:hypothetical protein